MIAKNNLYIVSVKANLRSKLSAMRGRSQNGQPVEYGEPLFIIG